MGDFQNNLSAKNENMHKVETLLHNPSISYLRLIESAIIY